MNRMDFYCVRCGKNAPERYQPFCVCGGMIEVRYPIDCVSLHDSENPYYRFADLLPLRMTRDRLPRDVRFTPVIHARTLGALLGMPSLYLKDETGLPTNTTKDRMAAVALGFLWERGVRDFCISSTGNSSTAYANAIRVFPDMRLYLFTAERFLPRVQHAEHGQVEHFCLRGASFVDAFEQAGAYARKHGLVSERGFFNLGRREGLKLSFLEANDQIPTPIDWYVQAVSSAMGVYGTYKGAKELLGLRRTDRLPRLLCVQQQSCSPMVQAFHEGCSKIQRRHLVPNPSGIAEAILRGNPTKAYPYVRRVVIDSRGNFVSVSEAEIREARRMVEELEGVSPCFSASAAVAGVIQQVRGDRLPRTDTVVINLTGGDRPARTPSTSVKWVSRDDDGWNLDSLGHPSTSARTAPSAATRSIKTPTTQAFEPQSINR